MILKAQCKQLTTAGIFLRPKRKTQFLFLGPPFKQEQLSFKPYNEIS